MNKIAATFAIFASLAVGQAVLPACAEGTVFEGTVFEGPLVIAHRGASGFLPEHTLEAYALAIEQGADFVEPDLVFTKDDVLIARHENYLSVTTDVAEHAEFRDRKKSALGREDWFTEDFTLAEIKTLRARQAFKGRSLEFDGLYEIPTFQEIIDLVARMQITQARPIGIYPEAKVPGHFAELGKDFADALLKILEASDLNNDTARVLIQSFEPEILKRLNQMTDVSLVQLVNPVMDENRKLSAGQSNIALADLKSYADGVGAMKMVLVTLDGTDTGYVQRAHDLGLFVHAWTFRDDAFPGDIFRSGKAEQIHFMELGVDGLFTDFPATGVASREAFADTEIQQSQQTAPETAPGTVQ